MSISESNEIKMSQPFSFSTNLKAMSYPNQTLIIAPFTNFCPQLSKAIIILGD
jgi:hypothetical protein